MSLLAPDHMSVVLTDGTEYEVRNTFADTLAWERYAVAHGLSATDNPLHMMAFYCWRGARKTGVCEQGTDLETFAELLETFTMPDPDEVNPTRPAPGVG